MDKRHRSKTTYLNNFPSLMICLCLFVDPIASRSEENLWEATRSAFSRSPLCSTSSTSHETKQWCFEDQTRQWKSCPGLSMGPGSESVSEGGAKLATRQLTSEPIELPNDLDEFILSLKFTIQSCDDVAKKANIISCSEEFSTEIFGLSERYPVKPDLQGARLFSKTEKTALGTALNENYPIENRSGYKYIIIQFTATFSCVILENIKLKAERCPSEVSNLVRYENAYSSQSATYEGKCVENSILNGKYLPLRKCSHGRWMSYYEASSCVCKPGFFLSNAECTACMENHYKQGAGNQNCLRCPLHATSSKGSPNCSCNPGFYHNPKSPNDPSCYQMPQKPQVWRVMNESNAVHMNVSTGVITTGSQLDVTCLNCGSLRPEVTYNSGSISIRGLAERTEYIFRVSAVNQVSSLFPDRTSVEVIAHTTKSRRVQSVSCIKSYDRIVISWNPVESDGDNASPWMHVTSSGNKVYMPQYWVKVHEGDSNTVMDFFTNETRFSTSNLNPGAQYMYKVGLRNDVKSFSNEVFCSNKGPMLTNEQIQGITILVGSISVVFVFLVTILFAVFCYYKKKRDEWHYKSYGTAGDVSKFNPDFKSIAASMHYSSHYNTSPSSYGTTLTPNQYLLSDINDNFNPNMEYSPFHAAVNLAAAEHDRLKEMGTVPLLACSGVDLYLEASQFYETYESLLLDYSRELPLNSLTLDPQTPQSPNTRGSKFNGSFGSGLFAETGSLLIDEKEGKVEKVKVTVMGENLMEDDLKIFAIQVMTMASFRNPNVLFLHGVVTTSSPLMCVIEDPDMGTLDTLLAQMRCSLYGPQPNYQSSSSDYMKIPFMTSSKDDPGHSPTSDAGGVHSSTKSSGSSCSGGAEHAGGAQVGATMQIPDMLHLLRGIALGMQYLHDGGIYVHKVLCSSNVYVNRNKMCKIGGFEMRAALEVYTHNAIFSAEQPPKQNNPPVLPPNLQEIHRILTPWTALEIFDRGPFTQASDVWSFGNIMWNIFSIGHKPFFEWNRNDIVKMLCTGYRLPPPDGCPDSVYELMMFCWASKILDRPTFSCIRQCLEKMICNPKFQISAMTGFKAANEHTMPGTDNRYFGMGELDYVDSADAFLDKIGMKNYQELFENNGICKMNDLLAVKNSTLKSMGVKSCKDRRKIVGAINALRASSRPAYLKPHSLIQPPQIPNKTIGTTLSRLV